jgi:hypothetical protein
LDFPNSYFLNGFAPYLGLKTQTSFSVFSSLITDNGTSNPLFMPSRFQLFNDQNEVVYIEQTNIKKFSSKDVWNKDKPYNYILFEFITIINKIETRYVEFQVENTPHYIEKKNGVVLKSTLDLKENALIRK